MNNHRREDDVRGGSEARVTPQELREHPRDVMTRATRETLTLVDDKGEARLLLSVLSED